MTPVAQPTPEQLAGVIRGLDNACEYCDSTSAFDSARNIRDAAAAIGLLRNSFDALTAERDALKEEDEFNGALIGRLGKILSDTANALKGPPDDLALHSTHDLAAVASAVIAQRDALTEANARLLAAAECAEAYELQDDWREILARHGWNENEQVASIFIRKLRREALAQVRK